MEHALQMLQVAPGLFQRARAAGVAGPLDDPPALRTPGPAEALRHGGAGHPAGGDSGRGGRGGRGGQGTPRG